MKCQSEKQNSKKTKKICRQVKIIKDLFCTMDDSDRQIEFEEFLIKEFRNGKK